MSKLPNYKNELDSINASPSWKADTKRFLAAEMEKKPAAKTRIFPIKNIVAIAAALLVLVGGGVFVLQNVSFGTAPPLDATLASAPGAGGADEQYNLPAAAQPAQFGHFSPPQFYASSLEAFGGAWLATDILGGLPATLPLYQNAWQTDAAGLPLDALTQPEMEAALQEVAGALSFSLAPFDAATNAEGVSMLRAEDAAAGVSVFIAADGIAYISFTTGTLPAAGIAPMPDAEVTIHEVYLQGVMAEYSPVLDGLLDMQSPTPLITRYSLGEEGPLVRYDVYDSREEMAGRLLNASRPPASFYFADGRLTDIMLYLPEEPATVDEYPLLSFEAAREMLLRGEGFAQDGAAFPGEECIEGVRLGYQGYGTDAMLVPYYEFFVRMPDDAAAPNGMYSYTVWYLPAIPDAYFA